MYSFVDSVFFLQDGGNPHLHDKKVFSVLYSKSFFENTCFDKAKHWEYFKAILALKTTANSSPIEDKLLRRVEDKRREFITGLQHNILFKGPFLRTANANYCPGEAFAPANLKDKIVCFPAGLTARDPYPILEMNACDKKERFVSVLLFCSLFFYLLDPS